MGIHQALSLLSPEFSGRSMTSCPNVTSRTHRPLYGVLFTGSPCYAEPFWRRDRDIFDNKTSRLCYPCSSDRCTNLHKETKKNFSHVIKGLYNYVNPKTRQAASMIPKETYDVVMANAKTLDSAIIYERDFRYNFFGFSVPTCYVSSRFSGTTSAPYPARCS
ncbi:hypothetical protein BGW80DRAFT_706631 [Lactifluus volemus]|nr:hypothetical protein BGW80DRAFT_692647 [Lactifluus volemus]KAH9978943.1 hypothetical protein BGW80DRAFT_706631 [Lactifluus volemus]